MNLTIDIPDECLVNYSNDAIISKIKMDAALIMFRDGELTAGTACKFAGVNRYTFYDQCRKYDIPVVQYDEQSLDDELKIAKKVVG